MLTLNGKKMAKSTGNNILPQEIFSGDNTILSKPFSATITKFFMYQAHYRSILDFSNDALMASEKGFNRLFDAYRILKNIKVSSTSDFNVPEWRQSCYDAMNDDFNSPILISKLFDVVKIINSIKEGKINIDKSDLNLLQKTLHDFIFDVLGLEDTVTTKTNDGAKLTKAIELLIELRNLARDNKDFEMSDKIRDQLLEAGIQLNDGKEGTTFSLN